jgi:osmotically-inducible protein OsmY
MEHGAEEPPHYLIQRVREALAHDPRVGELELRVKMVGPKVFVTGTVQTDERRRAISEIVHEILPDAEIHNETGVTPMAEADQEELP